MLYNINVKFSAINIKPFSYSLQKRKWSYQYIYINIIMLHNIINVRLHFHAKIGLVLKNTSNCSQHKIQKC